MLQSQWTILEAKANFSGFLDRARSRGPQTITCNGKLAAVIVSAEEWERKSRRVGNLAEFFAGSPLRDPNLQLERVHDSPRSADGRSHK
jgi:prevent-host-death family protein